MTASSDGVEGRGLFHGFEGYRTPTEDDYRHLLRQGLVVLDTNVLLDLYRMNLRVRTDMLTVLDSLRDRLWIPHQVLAEFWRNQQQDKLLGHHQDRAAAANSALSKAEESVRQAINRWAKDVHLGADAPIRDELDEQAELVSKAMSTLSELITRQARSDEVQGSPDTNKDPVITSLAELLDGRVGAAMTPPEYEQAVEKAAERAAGQIPPGYRDFENGKEKEAAAGDYLVWAQLLKEARNRGGDVLFVTRDLKEDWWRSTPVGITRQPRLELAEELRQLTGGRFFMLEPSNLMRQASRIFELGSRVDQGSVTALEQLETTEQPSEVRWTEDSLQALIDRLLETGPVQAQAILDAALNEGFVSRQTVYKLGGYDETRMLRGFTRPVKTATRYLQHAGVVTGDPEEILRAVYEYGEVTASGFRVADYTVPILLTLAERDYDDGSPNEE